MLKEQDLRALIRTELRALVEKEPSLTVREYAALWLAERKAQQITSADDDRTRLQLHVIPLIGDLPLSSVRPKTLAGVIAHLRALKLAPRTILNVYGTLRVMFSDAVRDELISGSPCILQKRRGELPKKLDRDPRWRCTAVFEREEVELLLTDPRIPLRRRVLYALELLAALRINEITPRRWSDYQPARPLWRLMIFSGYDPKHHVEKATPKGGYVRAMPVHPFLKQLLDEWRARGWGEFYGRPPGPDDLIVPSKMGSFLSSTTEWKRLQSDLRRLGLRHRRQHDSRRTFISLARADGATADLLHWITHGPDGGIMDLYTQPPWPVLCEQVAKLRIEPGRASVP